MIGLKRRRRQLGILWNLLQNLDINRLRSRAKKPPAPVKPEPAAASDALLMMYELPCSLTHLTLFFYFFFLSERNSEAELKYLKASAKAMAMIQSKLNNVLERTNEDTHLKEEISRLEAENKLLRHDLSKAQEELKKEREKRYTKGKKEKVKKMKSTRKHKKHKEEKADSSSSSSSQSSSSSSSTSSTSVHKKEKKGAKDKKEKSTKKHCTE